MTNAELIAAARELQGELLEAAYQAKVVAERERDEATARWLDRLAEVDELRTRAEQAECERDEATAQATHDRAVLVSEKDSYAAYKERAEGLQARVQMIEQHLAEITHTAARRSLRLEQQRDRIEALEQALDEAIDCLSGRVAVDVKDRLRAVREGR